MKLFWLIWGPEMTISKRLPHEMQQNRSAPESLWWNVEIRCFLHFFYAPVVPNVIADFRVMLKHMFGSQVIEDPGEA